MKTVIKKKKKETPVSTKYARFCFVLQRFWFGLRFRGQRVCFGGSGGGAGSGSPGSSHGGPGSPFPDRPAWLRRQTPAHRAGSRSQTLRRNGAAAPPGPGPSPQAPRPAAT